MSRKNKTIAEALISLGCTTPAIRQNNQLITGQLNPAIRLDPNNVRRLWRDRYGLPWGSRGDHSNGIGVISAFARRPDNPLNLEPHPYILGLTDQVDAAILGLPSGKSAWEFLRERLGDENEGGNDNNNDNQGGETTVIDCPPGWNCTPMPKDIKDKCISGEYHCTPVRGVKPSDKFVWRLMSGRARGKQWIQYNALRVNMNDEDTSIEEPPILPPVEPPTGPGEMATRQQQIAAALRQISEEIEEVVERILNEKWP